MVVQGYTDFSLHKGGPPLHHETPADDRQFAHFRIRNNISPLFPYINAVASLASYFPKQPFIRFVLDGFCCGLHPDRGVCAAFSDRQQALNFMDRLLGFLNAVSSRRDQLEPNYRAWNPVPALHIFQALPRTNCRVCGYPSCLAFAAAVSRQQAGPERCPGLGRPLVTQAVYPVTDTEGNLVSTVTLDVMSNTSDSSLAANSEFRPAAARPSASGGYIPLSGREKEVLRLVAQGATNLEIAAHLELSPHTVKSHVISIFNKLAVTDRTQAAVWAVRQHLV